MSYRWIATLCIAATTLLGSGYLWSQESDAPYLGVFAKNTEGSPKGAFVVEVAVDSPAMKAGFRRSDVILSVNGNKIESDEQLIEAIKKQSPGKDLTFEILRNGKEMKIHATLGKQENVAKAEDSKRNPTPNSERGNLFQSPFSGNQRLRIPNDLERFQLGPRPMIGVALQELNDELRDQAGLKLRTGVGVANVEKDSPAERAGISTTDIILEVNGKSVSHVNEVIELLQSKRAGEKVTLKIFRDAKNVEVSVTLENRMPATDPLNQPFGNSPFAVPRGFGNNPMDQLPWFNPRVQVDAAANERIRKLEKRVETLEATIRKLEEQMKGMKSRSIDSK